MTEILKVTPDDIRTDSVRSRAKNRPDEIALIDLRQEVSGHLANSAGFRGLNIGAIS